VKKRKKKALIRKYPYSVIKGSNFQYFFPDNKTFMKEAVKLLEMTKLTILPTIPCDV